MSIQARLIQIAFMCLMGCTCYSQIKVDTVVVHYQTKDFDVAILPPQEYPHAGVGCKQFMPTKTEVDSAEIALKRDIKTLDSPSPTKLVSYDLKKYRRQYFGYIDSTTGHKILYINCFWKSFQYANDWLKEDVDISEGGGYYCNLKFDLTTKVLFDFRVNGTE